MFASFAATKDRLLSSKWEPDAFSRSGPASERIKLADAYSALAAWGLLRERVQACIVPLKRG